MPPKKKVNGYSRPEVVPKGSVLRDVFKKNWVLGPPIGSGGFGDIYMAAEGESAMKRESDYAYVIKIEPSENGPLFVERHFYSQVGKKEQVESWMSLKTLKSFGMPILRGSGTHEVNGLKHRFVVIDRFSKDLWSLFLQNNRKFPLLAVLQITLQIHDVLEYIHHQNYVHADIKGANLLLGLKKGTENQVYLVDFGLACKYNTGEYKRDPRKAHNGTLEYTSRDAHFGVSTRRGDYEVLAYNVIQWLTSKLPWEDHKDAVAVEKCKHDEMKDVTKFLKKCFGKVPVPEPVSSFVAHISKLEPNEAPDYCKLRNIFVAGIKKLNGKVNGPLVFTFTEERENTPVKSKKNCSSPRKRPQSRVKVDNETHSSVAQPTQTEHQAVKRVRRTPIKNNEDPASENLTEEKTKKAPAKKSKAAQPSWRDCPTAQVSRVVKAGEYISSNPKRKKKD